MKTKQFILIFLLIVFSGCNKAGKNKSTHASNLLKEISNTKSGKIFTNVKFTCEAEEFAGDVDLQSHVISQNQALADTSANEDDGTEITMMVVYTTRAENRFVNTDSLLNSIRRAEQNTNEVFANNGIDLRLRIVHIEELSNFNEINMKSDLGALISGSRGDVARDLRDEHFADVVCLIRSDGGGRATLLNPTTKSYHSESAYMTIGSGCIDQSYFCFAHELGHLLGCNHNTEDTNLKGMYEYSYGWYFDLPSDNPNIGEIGTMMSYPGADNRILYFSDPNLAYKGMPIGSNKANNAKTILQTKKRVANYRVIMYVNRRKEYVNVYNHCCNKRLTF